MGIYASGFANRRRFVLMEWTEPSVNPLGASMLARMTQNHCDGTEYWTATDGGSGCDGPWNAVYLLQRRIGAPPMRMLFENDRVGSVVGERDVTWPRST